MSSYNFSILVSTHENEKKYNKKQRKDKFGRKQVGYNEFLGDIHSFFDACGCALRRYLVGYDMFMIIC